MQRTAQFSKSKIPCLVRHRGGRYYASVKVGGKVIRRCLETDDYDAAANRLPAVLAEIRGARNASEAGTLGAAVNAEAMRDDPSLKDTTRLYYRDCALSLSKVAKTMPVDPFGLPITKVSMAELRAFMDRYATVAADFFDPLQAHRSFDAAHRRLFFDLRDEGGDGLEQDRQIGQRRDLLGVL